MVDPASERAERARRMVVPDDRDAGPTKPQLHQGRREPTPAVTEDTASPWGDAPAQPPGPPRAKYVAPEPPPAVDEERYDLYCSSCGAGNVGQRSLCRSCGARLRPAAPPTPSPAPPVAQPVYRQPSRVGSAWKWAVPAVLVVALAATALGPGRSWVKGLLGGFDPVHPTGAEATSELADHPAGHAIDELVDTFWAARGPDDSVGQLLTITVDRPVDLDRIGFRNGASDVNEQFLAQPRLMELHVVFSDGTISDVVLKDKASLQVFPVSAKAVTGVEIQIVSVYGSGQGHNAALAEVELFTKS